MQRVNAYPWLLQGNHRQAVVAHLFQPSTARQLAHLLGVGTDACMKALWGLTIYELVRCLNPAAPASRLYWLTAMGVQCQRRLRQELGLPPFRHDLPRIDWSLYGSVCFSHRAAIIKALTEPLQPATIKRRALQRDPQLRMSANNVRDVIRLFQKRDVVRPIHFRGHKHIRYELTDLGRELRNLLLRAEVGR